MPTHPEWPTGKCEDGSVSEEIEPYPQAGLRDYAREGMEAGIAAIPIVGGTLEVLVASVITPSLAKRRERWIQKLAELVSELQAKVDGFDVTSLIGDEVFVTAVVDASRIAMGTHLDEKLNYLKHCLAHMAIDDDRDDFMDLQLIRFVELLSPEHFLILQYLASPAAWFDAKQIERPDLYAGSPGHLMDAAKLPVNGPSLEIVLRDLSSYALANTQPIRTVMTGNGAWQGLITELGRLLLNFVTDI